MRSVALLLLLLGGCDMLFQLDHVDPARGDASSGDGVIADAAPIDSPQSTACNVGSLKQLIIDAELTDPTQRPDQLEMYMGRFNNGDYDLFFVRRVTTADGWATPIYDSALSSNSDDDDPALFDAGRKMLFRSNRGGTYALYQLSRTTIADAWGAPIVIGTSGHVVEGFDVSPDGLTLYGTDGNGALEVFHRTMITGDFGAPGTIGSPIYWPSLTGDQLVIYYERNNIIYRATRSSLVGGFSKEEMVIAGNSPDISEDGKVLVFENEAGLAQLDCQ